MTKLFQYGGVAASVVLIAFGIGAVVTGIQGRDRVASELARERIVGTPDSSIPGQLVDSGSEAQAFATVIRKHTLEATDGKTYAEMPQYITASGKGTSDKAAAGKDPKTGAPTSNPARQIWVTETALTTALNTAYFAESMATFVAAMGCRPPAGRDRLPGPLAQGAPPAERCRADRAARPVNGGEGRRRRPPREPPPPLAPRGSSRGGRRSRRTHRRSHDTGRRTAAPSWSVTTDPRRHSPQWRPRSIGRARTATSSSCTPTRRRPTTPARRTTPRWWRTPLRTRRRSWTTSSSDCERLVTIDHERDLAVGSAAAAIIRAAETHEAAEIVIGSRGVGRMRALLGSVAHDVIHRARLPRHGDPRADGGAERGRAGRRGERRPNLGSRQTPRRRTT